MALCIAFTLTWIDGLRIVFEMRLVTVFTMLNKPWWHLPIGPGYPGLVTTWILIFVVLKCNVFLWIDSHPRKNSDQRFKGPANDIIVLQNGFHDSGHSDPKCGMESICFCGD